MPGNLQQQVFDTILQYCGSSEITRYAQKKLLSAGFDNQYVDQLKELDYQQIRTEKNIQQAVLAGNEVTLPVADKGEVIAGMLALGEKISTLIDQIIINIVTDSDANFIGCNFLADNMELSAWCEKNNLVVDDYIAGLQAYLESALNSVGISIKGGFFYNKNGRKCSNFDLASIIKGNKTEEILAKIMKNNGVLAPDGMVALGTKVNQPQEDVTTKPQ